MSVTLTKRTGESIRFFWTNPPAQNSFLDGFRLESAAAAAGPWNVEAAVFATAREVTRSADGHKFYRLASTKGASLAAYSPEIVEVNIDDTPPAPEGFSAE